MEDQATRQLQTLLGVDPWLARDSRSLCRQRRLDAVLGDHALFLG